MTTIVPFKPTSASAPPRLQRAKIDPAVCCCRYCSIEFPLGFHLLQKIILIKSWISIVI